MQKGPPENAPIGSEHDITFYTQMAEKNFSHKLPPYNYAMSQLGHEMGHRWAAFVSAKVNGEEIVLGPVHWARGLQAQVKFPYQRTVEASAMGGGVWQENPDRTYTQLDDDYYVPATGYSYLDLYLMGLISAGDVPDFFVLKNLVPVGKDASGHPIFKADKTRITIQDVIAGEGPRLPDVAHSQKKFNTGIVVDTHVARLSGRLGLTRKTAPPDIEQALMKLVPGDQWTLFSHWLIWHGRRRCFARRPDCSQCEILRLCPSGKIFLRTGQARKPDPS